MLNVNWYDLYDEHKYMREALEPDGETKANKHRNEENA